VWVIVKNFKVIKVDYPDPKMPQDAPVARGEKAVDLSPK